ncbi:JAB domain-containing protein [Anoxybacillus gonensis]|uniref:JAB domain-containing protein n=1 Tax=Anoxybacillus gonensis TaxID=198467 RepID=UPI0002BDD5C5|nr:JAB domain-containing protein [Anoxybacillus gonensis]EMI09198.1 DNA repair protein RadC [Anoxybacillus gonensis]
MKNYLVCKEEQLELINLGMENHQQQSAKRVNIISLKVVREKSFLYPKRRITSPEDAYNLVKCFLVDVDREYFLVICLDTKNQPTAINICHVGSLNASLVHPREVMKPAILSNSASVIVAHNHPSLDPTPSKEDINVTKRLIEAGRIMGIDILDHIVVGGNKYVSLKEKRYI